MSPAATQRPDRDPDSVPPRPAPRGLDVDALEAGSHRPEVQRLIREWIRRGAIRVVPMPGRPSHVRIVRNSARPDGGSGS